MTDPPRSSDYRSDELNQEPIRIDAQDARGAEIILRKRRNRMIFIAGLIAFVVLAVVANLSG